MSPNPTTNPSRKRKPRAGNGRSSGASQENTPRAWKYLNARDVGVLSNLFFEARRIVEGFYSGKHRSPFKGSSPEFVDFRQYNPGDELRSIDWKVHARTDRYYIKQYEKETDMNVYILLDKSGSMAFPLQRRKRRANRARLEDAGFSKLHYACHLCAALSYMLIRQGDQVGLTMFDDKVASHTPQGTTTRHLYAVLDQLEKASAGKPTSFAASLRQTQALLKRRGVVIVVSDMLDDPDAIFKTLSLYQHRGFEIILFQVLHKLEYRLPDLANANFIDAEQDAELTVVPADIKDGYNELLDEFVSEMASMAKARGIDYSLITTDTPYHAALAQYVQWRGKAGR